MAPTKKSPSKTTRAKPATTRKPARTAAKAPAKTAATKTVAAKPAAAKAPPAKAAPAVAPETPAAEAPAPKMLSKKELFERVKARTEQVKGRDVRAVMDVVLDEIGAALVAGETMKMRPLGVFKIQRHRELANGDLVICKLRRRKRPPEGKDPLAEAAE